MINHLFQWEWLSRWQNVSTYACNSKGPQGFVCICALPIYGFAGLAVVHLSNPAVCICRQVISTLRLEHRCISPKTICVFFNSNHLHFQTGDISTFVRVSTLAFDEPVTFSDCWAWCGFCKQTTWRKKNWLGIMTIKKKFLLSNCHFQCLLVWFSFCKEASSVIIKIGDQSRILADEQHGIFAMGVWGMQECIEYWVWTWNICTGGRW